jgi:hypothetical protein
MTSKFDTKQFIITTLIVSIWVNLSEVFRYFVIVLPKMREYLSVLPSAAAMDLGIFAIWGVWAMVLTALVVFMHWLVVQCFGHSLKTVLLAGTVSWLFFFVLFWVGLVNLGLAPVSLALTALPLAWLEMVGASWIAHKCYVRASI